MPVGEASFERRDPFVGRVKLREQRQDQRALSLRGSGGEVGRIHPGVIIDVPLSCQINGSVRAGVRYLAFPDDGFQVDIAAAIPSEALIKRRGGFPAGLALLVSLQRTLDDGRDRTMLASRQAVGQRTCLGTTNGQLRFGHGQMPHRFGRINGTCPACWQDSRGRLAVTPMCR